MPPTLEHEQIQHCHSGNNPVILCNRDLPLPPDARAHAIALECCRGSGRLSPSNLGAVPPPSHVSRAFPTVPCNPQDRPPEAQHRKIQDSL